MTSLFFSFFLFFSEKNFFLKKNFCTKIGKIPITIHYISHIFKPFLLMGGVGVFLSGCERERERERDCLLLVCLCELFIYPPTKAFGFVPPINHHEDGTPHFSAFSMCIFDCLCVFILPMVYDLLHISHTTG